MDKKKQEKIISFRAPSLRSASICGRASMCHEWSPNVSPICERFATCTNVAKRVSVRHRSGSMDEVSGRRNFRSAANETTRRCSSRFELRYAVVRRSCLHLTLNLCRRNVKERNETPSSMMSLTQRSSVYEWNLCRSKDVVIGSNSTFSYWISPERIDQQKHGDVFCQGLPSSLSSCEEEKWHEHREAVFFLLLPRHVIEWLAKKFEVKWSKIHTYQLDSFDHYSSGIESIDRRRSRFVSNSRRPWEK